MDHISIKKIVTGAKSGSSLYWCMLDALKLGAKRNETITVKHNSKTYTVDIKEIIKEIEGTGQILDANA